MSIGISSADSEPKRVQAGFSAVWPLSLSSADSGVNFSFEYKYGPDDDAPEWDIILSSSSGELWSNASPRKEVHVSPGVQNLSVMATCPKGARYEDSIDITGTVSDVDSQASIGFHATATKSVLTLKTQIDQEVTVATDLYNMIKDDGTERRPGVVQDVYAILCPDNLRGYIFVEGMNVDRLREKSRSIKKARNFLESPVDISEIENYLTPLSTVEGFEEGSLIEITKGPFKGEKARVKHIDESKEEITVELIDAMMPIPVTLNGDSVRVIEKEM
jgi:transcriptional antiterminator NusG